MKNYSTGQHRWQDTTCYLNGSGLSLKLWYIYLNGSVLGWPNSWMPMTWHNTNITHKHEFPPIGCPRIKHSNLSPQHHSWARISPYQTSQTNTQPSVCSIIRQILIQTNFLKAHPQGPLPWISQVLLGFALIELRCIIKKQRTRDKVPKFIFYNFHKLSPLELTWRFSRPSCGANQP